MNNYKIELRYIDNPNKVEPDIVFFVTNEAKHDHDIKIIKNDSDDNRKMIKNVFSQEYTYVYPYLTDEPMIYGTGYQNVKPGDDNYVKAAAFMFRNYGTKLIEIPIE